MDVRVYLGICKYGDALAAGRQAGRQASAVLHEMKPNGTLPQALKELIEVKIDPNSTSSHSDTTWSTFASVRLGFSLGITCICYAEQSCK